MQKFTNRTQYRQAEDIKRLKFICRRIGQLPQPAKILDVGCGNGHIGYQLASEGNNVLSIDLSPETIERARANYQHPNLRYEVRSAENIPENEKFDAIVCSEVLEHLYDPSQVVKSFDGILATGGIIVVTVPNGKGPREALVTRPAQEAMKKKNFRYKMMTSVKRMLGYSGNTVHSSNPDLEHVQFFSKKDLRQLADKHGFQITEFTAANFLEKVFPFSIICRFFVTLQWFDCWMADIIPVTWASGFNTVWKRK